MTTTTFTGVLVAMTCYRSDCAVTFGLERGHYNGLRESHEGFYCPHGHRQCFSGKTHAEKLADGLRARIVDNEREIARERERAEMASRRAVSAEMARRVAKGQLNKIRKRVGSGVCPCCNRTVRQLADHMKSKHPDFAEKV